MPDRVEREIAIVREMMAQGVTSSNDLQGYLGDEIREERREVMAQLTQKGVVKGADRTPDALRTHLRSVLTAYVDRLSDKDVADWVRYFTLTDPEFCTLFERVFGPLH